MKISRRRLFALPLVVPALMVKAPRDTAWTKEEAFEEAAAWEAEPKTEMEQIKDRIMEIIAS